MTLADYRRKRDFGKTPEPRGESAVPRKGRRFVIQKHAASRLHYDFRLELDGVLKSWAVPKGPSLDPAEKRLAVQVEDHPLEYGSFEGRIPKGQYGAGSVLVWDRGTWLPVGDPREGLRRGHLKFELRGEKLEGKWALIRMEGRGGEDGKKNWLLVKEREPGTRLGRSKDIVATSPKSVLSGRTIEDGGKRTWNSDRGSARASRKARASSAVDPKALPGARRAALPRWIPPQLATLVSAAPEGEEWIHEIKYDGYRFLSRVDHGDVRLLTRTGLDWTERFGAVAEGAAKLSVEQALLDGEVVVIRPDGLTSFQDLQNAMRRGRDRDLVYFLFDLVHLDGFDLTGVPLLERKGALAAVLAPAGADGVLRYSDHLVGQGREFYGEACRRRLEGIVSKRANATYDSGRTRAWLKTKCSARQEFVIGGFTEPRGSRSDLGALLLGVHESGDGLKYAGKVGTGFTRDSLHELRQRLRPIETPSPPFADPPAIWGAHWVKPRLVAEISFTSWTEDGRLRHPSFEGLREDKPASDVVAESPASKRSAARRPTSARSANPRHKDRSTKIVPRETPPPDVPRETPPDVPRGPGKRRTPKKPPRRKPPVDEPRMKPPVEEPPPPGRSPMREPPDTEGTSVAGIPLSHAQKILYPEDGLTKIDLARYVERVSLAMLPHVEGRPLMLLRCPEGRGRTCFFQKHPAGTVHRSLVPVRIREKSGKNETYLTARDEAGLVALVQMGVLEVHVWGARADEIEKPDRIVFDLDPGPKVTWSFVIETAHRVRELLQEIGLASFAKTTGGKGIHVVVPIRRGPSWDEIKELSAGIASGLVREQPDRMTTHLSKARREGRIFIDTLRNRRGATWVAPFSPRARPGAPVSTPVSWSELIPRLRPDRFTVRTVPSRLGRGGKDPWSEMESARQTVGAALLRSMRAAR
jgi:bifunctional non-homologous end joining protein LigD